MKTNTLEIIISLFNHQMNKALTGVDSLSPESAFILANSSAKQVIKAVSWLDTLVQKTHPTAFTPIQTIRSSIRVYSDMERHRLGDFGVNLLEELVQIKLLSLNQREAVIEQIQKLDSDEIPIHHLRWLLFIVLAAEAKSAQQLCWLDCLVLKDHKNRTLH